MWCFVFLCLVVSTSAVDCLERLVSEMTYYVSSGTLNPTDSPLLIHSKPTVLKIIEVQQRSIIISLFFY